MAVAVADPEVALVRAARADADPVDREVPADVMAAAADGVARVAVADAASASLISKKTWCTSTALPK